MEEKNKDTETFINENINLCPECQKPMQEFSGKYRCFKCGVEVGK